MSSMAIANEIKSLKRSADKARRMARIANSAGDAREYLAIADGFERLAIDLERLKLEIEPCQKSASHDFTKKKSPSGPIRSMGDQLLEQRVPKDAAYATEHAFNKNLSSAARLPLDS
jgi:hypothetical protein